VHAAKSPLTVAATACGKTAAMQALVLFRADKLAGCCEESELAIELERIANTADAYRRWPLGKEQGGKG